jgi:hypothetical protein
MLWDFAEHAERAAAGLGRSEAYEKGGLRADVASDKGPGAAASKPVVYRLLVESSGQPLKAAVERSDEGFIARRGDNTMEQRGKPHEARSLSSR